MVFAELPYLGNDHRALIFLRTWARCEPVARNVVSTRLVKARNEAFVVLAIKLCPDGIGVYALWNIGEGCPGEVRHWLILVPPCVKSCSRREDLGVIWAKMLIISHVARVFGYEFDAKVLAVVRGC
jgi:hypothetical protein